MFQGSCHQSFHHECVGLNVRPTRFKCDECVSDEHECFLCKNDDKSDGGVNLRTRKCSVATCGKYYHDECVKKNESFRKDTSWTQNKPNFICPMHSCSTCWAETKVRSTYI